MAVVRDRSSCPSRIVNKAEISVDLDYRLPRRQCFCYFYFLMRLNEKDWNS